MSPQLKTACSNGTGCLALLKSKTNPVFVYYSTFDIDGFHHTTTLSHFNFTSHGPWFVGYAVQCTTNRTWECGYIVLRDCRRHSTLSVPMFEWGAKRELEDHNPGFLITRCLLSTYKRMVFLCDLRMTFALIPKRVYPTRSLETHTSRERLLVG